LSTLRPESLSRRSETCAPRHSQTELPRQGILVIDDEPAIRMLVQLGLQDQDLTVFTAGNGPEGVQIYQANQERIGIVLLDVKMPGLDGPRTLPLLQRINPEVCCCFVTGDTGVYDEQELLRLGAAAVLRKPFSLTHLAQMLRHMLVDLAHAAS
jgi:CheY-like chemotaxis protein